MKYPVLIEIASENGLWRGILPDFEGARVEAGTPEALLRALGNRIGERLEALAANGLPAPSPTPAECAPMPESFSDWRLARVDPEGGAEIFYPCDLIRVAGGGAFILTCNTPSLSFMGENLEDVKSAMQAGIGDVLEMRRREGKPLSALLPFPEALGMRSQEVVLIPVSVL